MPKARVRLGVRLQPGIDYHMTMTSKLTCQRHTPFTLILHAM